MGVGTFTARNSTLSLAMETRYGNVVTMVTVFRKWYTPTTDPPPVYSYPVSFISHTIILVLCILMAMENGDFDDSENSIRDLFED